MALAPIIIFTDMDGSLLDHYTYSHEEASRLLNWLSANHIPVIPCTSKTRAEMEKLRIQLQNDHPFIVENGAAIYIPDVSLLKDKSEVIERHNMYVKEFVERREHWQSLLQLPDLHLNEAYISFEQAGFEGIMQMTGLSEENARLASQREYGEPIKWVGTQDQFEQFEKHIVHCGGQLLKGGRFIHISGDSNKGIALNWLLKQYRHYYQNDNIVSVALGDSHNDIAMLEAVDHAIVIRSPAHELPTVNAKNSQDVYITQQQGPRGWVEGVTRVLNKLQIKID